MHGNVLGARRIIGDFVPSPMMVRVGVRQECLTFGSIFIFVFNWNSVGDRPGRLSKWGLEALAMGYARSHTAE